MPPAFTVMFYRPQCRDLKALTALLAHLCLQVPAGWDAHPPVWLGCHLTFWAGKRKPRRPVPTHSVPSVVCLLPSPLLWRSSYQGSFSASHTCRMERIMGGMLGVQWGGPAFPAARSPAVAGVSRAGTPSQGISLLLRETSL